MVDRGSYKKVVGDYFCSVVRMIYGEGSMTASFPYQHGSNRGNEDVRRGK